MSGSMVLLLCPRPLWPLLPLKTMLMLWVRLPGRTVLVPMTLTATGDHAESVEHAGTRGRVDVIIRASSRYHVEVRDPCFP